MAAELEDEEAQQVAFEDAVVSSAIGHAVALAQLYGCSREDFLRLAEHMYSIGQQAIQMRVRGGSMTIAVDSDPSIATNERVTVSSTNRKKEETS